MSTDDNSESFFKLLARSIPNEEYLELVVTLALEHQRQSKSKHPSLKRLRVAINNSRLEIEGWRSKAAASAPTPRLVAPVADLMPHSNDLAEAVFSVWADRHEALRLVAAHHLNQLDLEICRFTDEDGKISDGWDPMILDIQIGDIVDNLYKNDIYLMLCFLSGLLPPRGDEYPEYDEQAQADDLASLRGTVFGEWIDHLQSLPRDGPEWDQVKAFERSVSNVIQTNEAERVRVSMLDVDIDEIKTTFSEELQYLERNIDTWSAAKLPHSQVAPVFDLVGRLLESLEEYRPLLQLAASRREEQARRAKREELEPRLLRLIDDIEARMTGGETPPDPDGSADRPSPATDVAPEAPSTGAFPETPPERKQATKSKPKRAKSRAPSAPKAETNGKSNVSLHRKASEMSASGRREPRSADQPDSQSAGEETEEVAADPTSGAPQAIGPEAEAPAARYAEPAPVEVEDVAGAVSLAKAEFPEQLRFALNAKSDIDTPFENPATCWRALEWLATTYRDSRRGKVSVPDLEFSLYEACGWKYSRHQSETTMGEYEDYYTARYERKKYDLHEHLGKGGNKNPRHTIRVAFAWDKDLEVVIIGYIGQHQRTAAT